MKMKMFRQEAVLSRTAKYGTVTTSVAGLMHLQAGDGGDGIPPIGVPVAAPRAGVVCGVPVPAGTVWMRRPDASGGGRRYLIGGWEIQSTDHGGGMVLVVGRGLVVGGGLVVGAMNGETCK